MECAGATTPLVAFANRHSLGFALLSSLRRSVRINFFMGKVSPNEPPSETTLWGVRVVLLGP
eukprot:scaffold218265_cov28-Tisochrysis_lutea.AAC.2